MNKTIDFTKLKRIPSSNDIEEAQKQLETVLPEIIQRHFAFFESNKHPKKIDYIVNHSISSKGGFIQVPYPEILFMDSWLIEEIREEVAIKFYEYLFSVVNTN